MSDGDSERYLHVLARMDKGNVASYVFCRTLSGGFDTDIHRVVEEGTCGGDRIEGTVAAGALGILR